MKRWTFRILAFLLLLGGGGCGAGCYHDGIVRRRAVQNFLLLLLGAVINVGCTVAASTARPATASSSTQRPVIVVTRIDDRNGLIEINAGERQGIILNAIYVVARDGTFVANVVATNVDLDRAEARITLAKTAIAKGDVVRIPIQDEDLCPADFGYRAKAVVD